MPSSILPEFQKLLGTMPDSTIAVLSGVDRRSICGIRNRLGIAPFTGYALTQEGIGCRSIYEAMLDAILHEREEPHEHEVPIPDLPYIADFLVRGTYVEVVGALGNPRYAAKMIEKHRAYDQAGLCVTYIEPGSLQYLYRSCTIPLKFRERRCIRCGADNPDLVRGLCRKTCYRHGWSDAQALERTCATCGKGFRRAYGKPLYCSRPCYWESLRGIPFPHQRTGKSALDG